MQTQLALAYALTIHKSQGITVPVSYPSLSGIFGFGQPYTLLTRTPFRHNMLFVGVPPKDVLDQILQPDRNGVNRLRRKQQELRDKLQSDEILEAEILKRVAAGEFDLEDIGASLSEETHSQTQAEVKELALTHLCERLKLWYEGWSQRLTRETGLTAMVKVSEGFSYKAGRVIPWKGREHMWCTLAQILQGDKNERLRIQFYHEVATHWFTEAGVNVLAMCRLGEPCFPLRDRGHGGRQPILQYTVDSVIYNRPAFPQKPADFHWACGKQEVRGQTQSAFVTNAGDMSEPNPQQTSMEYTPCPTNTSAVAPVRHQWGGRKRQMEDVAKPVLKQDVKLVRYHRKFLNAIAKAARQRCSRGATSTYRCESTPITGTLGKREGVPFQTRTEGNKRKRVSARYHTVSGSQSRQQESIDLETLSLAGASVVIPRAYWPMQDEYIVSPRLQTFLRENLPEPWYMKTFETGARGDCLFHSVAALLEHMLSLDTEAATHVTSKVPAEHFGSDKSFWVQGR